MHPSSDNGLLHISSPFSFAETTKRVEAALHSKGLSIFCRIDHSGEAAKIGMKMPPTLLLIVGNPKGGTPLMLASPTLAIDLPLKILLWEDSANKVWLSCNTPEYLQHRHNIPPELLPNIAVLGALLQSAISG